MTFNKALTPAEIYFIAGVRREYGRVPSVKVQERKDTQMKHLNTAMTVAMMVLLLIRCKSRIDYYVDQYLVRWIHQILGIYLCFIG